MGKPSKGTPADKRLKSVTKKSRSKKNPFGNKKKAPFGKGNKRDGRFPI